MSAKDFFAFDIRIPKDVTQQEGQVILDGISDIGMIMAINLRNMSGKEQHNLGTILSLSISG